jgi:alpha-tubulin suppressor-like RCC1 family protein
MQRKSFLTAAAFFTLLLNACSGDSAAPTGPSGPEPVASVQVSPSTTSLPVGQSTRLEVTLRDGAGRTLTGRTISWSSDKQDVVRVAADGTVTAVLSGTATITASSEGESGSASVTVSGTAVASVTITTSLDSLEAFDTRPMQATLKDAEGNVLTGRAISWTSSNPAVATVDPASGLLTGLDRGTVTITATSEGKTDSVSRVVVIRYRSISAGTSHACDIASGGVVWCWGLNGKQGRIGQELLADDAFSAVPVRLPGGLRFAQLATYAATTCGITLEGAAYCWGSNNWGALGAGSNVAQSFTPVAVAGGYTFKQIVAGGVHFCGLTMAGRAMCWGGNSGGELGNGLRVMSGVPVALSADLTFKSLAAGSEFTCGITVNGEGWCWGYDGLGNLGDGRKPSYGNTYTLTPVRVATNAPLAQMSAGQQHVCAVTESGQGLCWGRNGGRLGSGNTTDTSAPVAVTGGYTFRSIAAGHTHSCGVTTQGDVYCWGANGNGQLGLVMVNGSVSPVRVSGGVRGAEVAAANIATGSASYSCAISPDRLTTRCWGRNDLGQLGNGATTIPTAVNPDPTIVQGQKPL